LPTTFFVVATQNPIEFEGTWPLPEAQTDRFLMKLVVGYPDADSELRLLELGPRHTSALPAAVIDVATLHALQQTAAAVRVDDSVRRYVLALLHATRTSSSLRLGASPRAGLMLVAAAQAHALLQQRDFVLPDDVKAVAISVLRHRLTLSTDAELDGLDVLTVVSRILASVPVLPAVAAGVRP
jgi:MoxR-like ATPase